MNANTIDNVTVKEICDGAEINRATFYKHYKNLQALLDEIDMELSKEIINALPDYYSGKISFETTLDTVMQCYINEKLVCRFRFGDLNTGKPPYAHKLGNDLAVEYWLKKGNITRKQAEYLRTFLTAGTLALLREWYLSGFKEDIDVFKKDIVNIYEKCAKGFFSEDE